MYILNNLMEYRKRSVSNLILHEKIGITESTDDMVDRHKKVHSYYFCCMYRFVRRLLDIFSKI